MDLLIHELCKEIYFTLDIKCKLQDKPKLILELWMKINPAPGDPVDPSPSLLHQDCPLLGHKMAIHFAFSADKNPVILSWHRSGSNLVVVCWLNSPWNKLIYTSIYNDGGFTSTLDSIIMDLDDRI